MGRGRKGEWEGYRKMVWHEQELKLFLTSDPFLEDHLKGSSWSSRGTYLGKNRLQYFCERTFTSLNGMACITPLAELVK